MASPFSVYLFRSRIGSRRRDGASSMYGLLLPTLGLFLSSVALSPSSLVDEIYQQSTRSLEEPLGSKFWRWTEGSLLELRAHLASPDVPHSGARPVQVSRQAPHGGAKPEIIEVSPTQTGSAGCSQLRIPSAGVSPTQTGSGFPNPLSIADLPYRPRVQGSGL